MTHPSPHRSWLSQIPLLAWGSLAVLALCGGVSLWQQRHAPGRDPMGTGARLVPAFPAEQVDRLEFRRPKESFAIVRQDGRWLIPSRWNYPADAELVRSFLRRVDEATVLQRVPVATARHLAALQVAENSPEASYAAGLEVTGSVGTRPLFQLVLGLPHWNASLASRTEAVPGAVDARYVRVPATGLVALASDPFDSDFQQVSLWMNHVLWELGGLKAVRLLKGGKPAWTLSKPMPEDRYTLAPIQAGETLSAEGLRKFYALLSQTTFDDVADPKLTPAQTGLEAPTASCELEDFQGRRLVFAFGKETPAGVYTKISCVGGRAPGVPAELFDGWVYLFHPDLVKGLTCPRESLVEKP